MMVSLWWALWAFLGGGFAGMLVTATVHAASAEDDRMEIPVDLICSRSPNPSRFGV